LPYIAVGGHQHEFTEQLQCADLTDARRALQEAEPAVKLVRR
jgi:hypothetical protein